MLMETADDDGSGRAAALIDEVLGRFDLGDRWAYHALHDDGRCFGLSERQLRQLYREAELIVNLHGGTEPLPELAETGRLVYLETDPVQLQIELHDGLQASIDFLAAHCALFTFAENLGTDVCGLPVSRALRLPADPPAGRARLLAAPAAPPASCASRPSATGGSSGATVDYEGERYGWSKDDEWSKFLDLPQRTGQRFELALSGDRAGRRRSASRCAAGRFGRRSI